MDRENPTGIGEAPLHLVFRVEKSTGGKRTNLSTSLRGVQMKFSSTRPVDHIMHWEVGQDENQTLWSESLVDNVLVFFPFAPIATIIHCAIDCNPKNTSTTRSKGVLFSEPLYCIRRFIEGVREGAIRKPLRVCRGSDGAFGSIQRGNEKKGARRKDSLRDTEERGVEETLPTPAERGSPPIATFQECLKFSPSRYDSSYSMPSRITPLAPYYAYFYYGR